MGRFWAELTPQVLCVAFLVGVLGNLAASALLGVPALWHLHRKLGRQHEDAAAARRIAADLYKHHTGEAHPDAPAKPESEVP